MQYDIKGLELKDAIVFAPIVSTSMALFWEIGRFYRFGGFYFFSFSEHLVGAASALPLTVLIVVVVGLMLIPVTLWVNRLGYYGRVVFLVVALCYLAGFVFAYSFGWVLGLRLPIGSAIVAALALNGIWPRYPIASLAGLCACYIAAVSLTFVASLDLYDDLLRGGWKDSLITTKIGTIKGKIIMAGERGVLLYRPDIGRVMFQRLDEIRSVDWEN